jgi:CRP-like cAMP-binding protein
LLQIFNSIKPFPDGLREYLSEVVDIQVVKKKVFLLKAGQISSRIFYIESGLVLCYRRVGDEKVISGIRKEGEFLIPIDSFSSQARSTEYLFTLEDCVLCVLQHDHFQAIYKEFPEFNIHMRLLLEQHVKFAEGFLHVFRFGNAQDRCNWLFDHFPHLSKRIPTKYLASYIGITQQSFNRVKRERFGC